MRACISPEKKYKTCTCYFCKACHRERFGYPKQSRKWDNTPCLTCGDMLPEEYNWIDVAIRGGVCDQTCQYALSISKKVRRGTPFDAAYNSALNKLYHYLHDAEMIFDLAMALINRATQKNVYCYWRFLVSFLECCNCLLVANLRFLEVVEPPITEFIFKLSPVI
ncbi:hypothetical protein G9A89_019130 [Geosiphon pyriformis]|nr:hypothetical protein G9A89_019130 [Geosiphon pyriformis]